MLARIIASGVGYHCIEVKHYTKLNLSLDFKWLKAVPKGFCLSFIMCISGGYFQ